MPSGGARPGAGRKWASGSPDDPSVSRNVSLLKSEWDYLENLSDDTGPKMAAKILREEISRIKKYRNS